MMADLISRQDALTVLLTSQTFQDVHEALEHLPAVEAVQMVRGEWVADSDGLPVCSVCDEVAMQRLHCDTLHETWRYDVRLVKTNYCPNCGAKMNGGTNDG